MQAKLNEADQNLEAANAKISQLEKVKLRMSQEMEDLVIEVERVSFIEKYNKSYFTKVRINEFHNQNMEYNWFFCI